MWHVLTLVGVVHLVARRRYLLPLWFAATVVIFPKHCFLVLVGAFVIAAVVFNWLARLGDERISAYRNTGERILPLLLLALLASSGVVTGGLYAADYEPILEHPLQRLLQEPLPSYVDDEDLTVMQ